MTKYIYTLNKNVVPKEEREKVSERGYKCLADTITERVITKDGYESQSTYYIFTGRHTPYGWCVKHGDKYVFARWARWDCVSTDLTEMKIDCDEVGNDDTTFTTYKFNSTIEDEKHIFNIV